MKSAVIIMDAHVMTSRSRPLKQGFEWFARALFRLYLPLRVSGALPGEPSLVCSNHTSHLDSIALMIASGRPFASFRLLAASDYFAPESRAGRLTRSVLNIIGIDRSSAGSAGLRQTIAECADTVREHGVHLIAFPEGTRSMRGGLLPFKRGAGLLAVALNLPVVPAYIEGTRAAMPKGAWLPRPGRLAVRFGAPIRPADWEGLPGRKAQYAYVTSELERRVMELAARAAGDPLGV
ncbi:MAG TPA: lysophospholipid acyltransferase family protein [Vicinamibacterales bacterium]